MNNRFSTPKGKAFVFDFIQVYQSLPALWKNTSADYHNRYLRDDGYKILLQKMKEFDSDATIENVKGKINALRTDFRKNF